MKFGGVEEELGGYGLHGHLLVRVGHVGEPFNKRNVYKELYMAIKLATPEEEREDGERER